MKTFKIKDFIFRKETIYFVSFLSKKNKRNEYGNAIIESEQDGGTPMHDIQKQLEEIHGVEKLLIMYVHEMTSGEFK